MGQIIGTPLAHSLQSVRNNLQRSMLLIFEWNWIDYPTMCPLGEDFSVPETPCDTGERRHAARLRQDKLLKCNLGEVCNLSRSGMRIKRKRIPTRSFLKAKLSDGDCRLSVNVEVVWIKKLGYRCYEMGLRFVDPTNNQMATITQFAMYNHDKRTF